MTEVVAALIWNGNRFLACQRPPHKARALLWEFVGGKVEPGETKAAALIRECREELGVTVSVSGEFMDVVHAYPDLTVHLTLMNASIKDGTPQLLEHNDLRWLSVEELDQYMFCPADETILDALKAGCHKSLENTVRIQLFALRDESYQIFNAKLIPNIDPEYIIGIRTPVLRSFAKEFAKTSEADHYLSLLPHRYLEENGLHSSLISRIRDYGTLIAALDAFLPYVDNWATCDCMSPALFRSHPEPLPSDIRRWLNSSHPYTVRFGIDMLMAHYLGQFFQPEYLEWVACLEKDHYYISMAAAWFFATALAKQYETALPYITEYRLDRRTHNRAVQKAIESRRISDSRKQYLRTLKQK